MFPLHVTAELEPQGQMLSHAWAGGAVGVSVGGQGACVLAQPFVMLVTPLLDCVLKPYLKKQMHSHRWENCMQVKHSLFPSQTFRGLKT